MKVAKQRRIYGVCGSGFLLGQYFRNIVGFQIKYKCLGLLPREPPITDLKWGINLGASVQLGLRTTGVVERTYMLQLDNQRLEMLPLCSFDGGYQGT